MIQELLYTSAPRGLKPGSQGFCTVMSSRGLSEPLALTLESLSGYRPLFAPSDPRASENPINWMFLTTNVGGKPYFILSRVADYGLDYSQRTNKLAHHLAMEQSDLISAGPAWVLTQAGVMLQEWEGEPRLLSEIRKLPNGDPPPTPCRAWEKLTGDAGWAGVLAECAMSDPIRPAVVIFSPGMDLLTLFQEALSLLPPQRRWKATFSTYFTNLPQSVSCSWRGMLGGSQEANQSRRMTNALRIDLTQPLGRAPETLFAERARTGRQQQVQPAATSTSRFHAVTNNTSHADVFAELPDFYDLPALTSETSPLAISTPNILGQREEYRLTPPMPPENSRRPDRIREYPLGDTEERKTNDGRLVFRLAITAAVIVFLILLGGLIAFRGDLKNIAGSIITYMAPQSQNKPNSSNIDNFDSQHNKGDEPALDKQISDSIQLPNTGPLAAQSDKSVNSQRDNKIDDGSAQKSGVEEQDQHENENPRVGLIETDSERQMTGDEKKNTETQVGVEDTEKIAPFDVSNSTPSNQNLGGNHESKGPDSSNIVKEPDGQSLKNKDEASADHTQTQQPDLTPTSKPPNGIVPNNSVFFQSSSRNGFLSTNDLNSSVSKLIYSKDSNPAVDLFVPDRFLGYVRLSLRKEQDERWWSIETIAPQKNDWFEMAKIEAVPGEMEYKPKITFTPFSEATKANPELTEEVYGNISKALKLSALRVVESESDIWVLLSEPKSSEPYRIPLKKPEKIDEINKGELQHSFDVKDFSVLLATLKRVDNQQVLPYSTLRYSHIELCVGDSVFTTPKSTRDLVVKQGDNRFDFINQDSKKNASVTFKCSKDNNLKQRPIHLDLHATFPKPGVNDFFRIEGSVQYLIVSTKFDNLFTYREMFHFEAKREGGKSNKKNASR